MEEDSLIVKLRADREKDNQLKLSLKKGLNLSEIFASTNRSSQDESELFHRCLLCPIEFHLSPDPKPYLAHLLKDHKLVISDVDQIGNFAKYNSYWREKLSNGVKIEDICFKINTNMGANDKGEIETFYLLSDDLPEDNDLRKKLNIYKLEKALKQLEIERNDKNFYRRCFFCNGNKQIGNTKAAFINHWSVDHNFNIGNADNIVYFDEFYQKLYSRFESLQCLFCEKIFYDKFIHKEHMRKKKHKCIDPNNREFDRFYIINYLEYHKFWQEIKLEKDYDDPISKNTNEQQLEDWVDPVQNYFCLFCEDSYDNEDEIIGHMKSVHEFDFRKYISDNKELSFYSQVKVINYIRRQTYLGYCHVCSEKFQSKEEQDEHWKRTGHVKEFPSPDLWDQPEYYFSTFEDDSLLCLLDDNAYSKDEQRIKVIPEDMKIKIHEAVLDNLKELKE